MAREIRRRWETHKDDFFCEGESLTKQADAFAADINNIIGQFFKFPGVQPLAQREGTFANVSEIGDYLSCLNTVKQAEQIFADLPAPIRDHFGNNPTELVMAIYDPTRVKELTDLGIYEAPPAAVSSPAPGAPAPATGEAPKA